MQFADIAGFAPIVGMLFDAIATAIYTLWLL
jgi:hypothetical protein